MGSSHQNVKQILLKLEKKEFVEIVPDSNDKRKQRVILTEKCMQFCNDNDDKSTMVMKSMFEGITQEQLQVTIQTIIQMEHNLKRI